MWRQPAKTKSVGETTLSSRPDSPITLSNQLISGDPIITRTTIHRWMCARRWSRTIERVDPAAVHFRTSRAEPREQHPPIGLKGLRGSAIDNRIRVWGRRCLGCCRRVSARAGQPKGEEGHSEGLCDVLPIWLLGRHGEDGEGARRLLREGPRWVVDRVARIGRWGCRSAGCSIGWIVFCGTVTVATSYNACALFTAA
jgi:hypothetical protein